MMQTLNPYSGGGNSTARTAEIMARYRPIAPRPLTSSSSSHESQCDSPGSGSGSGSMSPTIRQSPYLRNVWPHLQSRPTRTRKRGRTSLGPAPPSGSGRGGATSFKRPRSTLLQGLSPPYHVTNSQPTTTLVTLPLLYQHNNNNMHQTNNDVVIDINKTVPEEKDLLGQLQKTKPKVISPTPIRLIRSTVTIQGIKEYYDSSSSSSFPISQLKKSQDIEKELETQSLPAFVSDSNNKVRLVNSPYKQMVGQPECSWLDSMVTPDGLGVACKTICGEVELYFMDQDKASVVLCKGGFSCWTRIEWVVNVNGNKKKNSVNAFGEAIKLECESKHYKFAWRFHTTETSDPTVSM